MIDKDKAEDYMGKAVDFMNESGQKLSNYAKEHEWEEKLDTATDTIEEKTMKLFHKIKDKFNNL